MTTTSTTLTAYAEELEGLADEIDEAMRTAALASAVLDGCEADGETPAKARRELAEAMAGARAALDSMREHFAKMNGEAES